MRGLEKIRPLTLLLLRLVLGAIFIYSGYPKLFTHARESMQDFVRMGLPGYFSYFVGSLEFFGGMMLVAGLFTRVAGLLLAIEMALEVSRVHMIYIHPLEMSYYEFILLLAVASFAIATFGAGVVSFDQVIFPEGRARPKKPKSRD